MGDGFAWTIPLIQLCFAVLFLAARRAGAAREAGVWSGAYLLNAAAFAASMLDPILSSRAVAVATDVLFALSFFRFADALVIRYSVRDPRPTRLALLAAAVTAPVAAVLEAGSVPLELLASDLGCAIQIGLPLVMIRHWPKRWIDRGMLALSWLVVFANVCRMISVPVTAADATFASFVDTTYSCLMYADGMVTGIAFGVLALIAVTAELIAGFRRDAHVDPLTGLLNRRGLDAAVGSHHRTREDGLIACDLDHFKRVNDTFGHETGDRVLVVFADLIRSVLPPGGRAARVGGEEFILYLPGHSLVQSSGLAVRLSVAMMQYEWSGTGLTWRQTASFGVAARESGQNGLANAIRAADTQLYEAKRHGRDQVRGPLAA